MSRDRLNDAYERAQGVQPVGLFSIAASAIVVAIGAGLTIYGACVALLALLALLRS